MARYLTQLPVGRDRLVTMGEGDTPLLATQALGPQLGLRRLLVKDERQNPTGSWRDRFAALAVSQIEDSSVTVGGAGDEAQCVSLASYAARAGLRSVSLVDTAVSERARDAIEAVGGRVVGVTNPEGRWPLLADAERTLGWRAVSNRASPPIGSDPLAIEGYRTIAYEIAEQLRFGAPDLVVAPAGLGDGLQGIWRGFRELVSWGLLDRIPRMVAVELGGAVASALASGKDWVAPTGYVESPARALAGVTGTVQTLHAVVVQVGAALEGRQHRLPEDLVHPRAPDARDDPLVAQQRMHVARQPHEVGQLLDGRRWQRFRTERGDHLVVHHLVRRQQLAPRALLRAELDQAQLSAVGQADQDPR